MSSRRALSSSLAVVVLFALPLLPEILGTRRLVFRDAQVTHWPWRRVAAAALARGEVPFVNEAASGGQPLLANPNAVLLYPTFLLELAVPPAVAFNLHFLLHVLWAFFGARRLARELGLADDAAFLAGAAFAFSGMVLSYGAAFMNSIAAAAWLPWCAAAALALVCAPGRKAAARAAVALGLALGLQLLAGEPALSLLTVAFAGALGLARAVSAPRGERRPRLVALLAGTAGAGLLALALAAPLLLPLARVFPLTYRGQHLYSEKAFGAAALTPARTIEWLLPRFGGDPGTLGGGANWLAPSGEAGIVYIWCVSFGIVPLVVILLAALRRDFWSRRCAALAGGGLLALALAFGFALPLYRLVYAVEFLRRLRYPIKFYLLTTLCVALLAGLAAEALARRRAGRADAVPVLAVLAALAAAWWMAAPGGTLDAWASPAVASVSANPDGFLSAFRGAVRGDALVGSLAALATVLAWKRVRREAGYVLGLLTLVASLVWGLPLFVTARETELARPPALVSRVAGDGRLYVSPRLPRFDAGAIPVDAPGDLPRSEKTARVMLEQLVPATAAEFGVRYLFETDPDGSYGFYNRLANEVADASTPAERDRLLRAFGARWALADEGEEHPLFRASTGFAVAGRRLVLYENPEPVAELRWAGRAWRRRSLSGTLELVRSDRFEPSTDVAFPGPRDEDPTQAPSEAGVAIESLGADRAAATIDAAAPGHLLFSRTFFPAWRARVDGLRAPVGVANGRDLAVAVPAGRHRVELEYDRGPFRRGVAIQAAALLAALAAAAATRARPTGRGPAPAPGA